MKLLFLAIAFVAGATSSVQVIVNAQLRTYLMHPMQATFVSFAVGTLASSVYCLILRSPWPSSMEVTRAPWWVWIGGLLGTLFVWSSIVVSPRIGVAALLCAVVAGQMMASLLIDHFGWFNATPFPVSTQRLLGATLVVMGALVMATGK
jgi:bacterial/archaeal transporter family-2 protein